MRAALARHDAITRAAVESHRGTVVKMTGDGVDAAFADPLDAIAAVLRLQQAVANPSATAGITLHVRCGLHAGAAQHRDDDFFGTTVNRAARIMSAAHGGQVLLSEAVAVLVRDRLPAGVALHDLGALTLRGLASPEHVYQVVHPRLRVTFPALRSLTTPPNNLPQHLTSFCWSRPAAGRDQGVAWQNSAVDLVWGRRYRQNSTVAGIRRRRHGRLFRRRVVRGTRAADRCAARAASGSVGREHLHVAGETTYSVPALAGPEPSHAIVPAELMEFEAVRLFVERAQAAQPSFAVTDKKGRWSRLRSAKSPIHHRQAAHAIAAHAARKAAPPNGVTTPHPRAPVSASR